MQKLLNVNFEFVSIENQAKYVALSSKKIDLIFCNFDTKSPDSQSNKNKTWIATNTYFVSEGSSFIIRK